MKLLTTPADMQEHAQALRAAGVTIGLVPTMGWFHEGHLSLMRKAKEMADRVIVTLFVNPMQFAPGEDLASYPHDLERDRALAEQEGVDVLYAPAASDMYGHAFKTIVHVNGLTDCLCGAARPGHFDGVTTVVAKLFNLTLPHFAVFGEKDFQQLAVIRQLVSDLDFPIEIIGHPIVREESGLAMSSRNTYLQESEMEAALSLSQGIAYARDLAASGFVGSCADIEKGVADIIVRHPQCAVEYVKIVDGNTLQPATVLTKTTVLLLAVKINKRIRLIDNSPLISR